MVYSAAVCRISVDTLSGRGRALSSGSPADPLNANCVGSLEERDQTVCAGRTGGGPPQALWNAWSFKPPEGAAEVISWKY